MVSVPWVFQWIITDLSLSVTGQSVKPYIVKALIMLLLPNFTC